MDDSSTDSSMVSLVEVTDDDDDDIEAMIHSVTTTVNASAQYPTFLFVNKDRPRGRPPNARTVNREARNHDCAVEKRFR
eukprot:CAMPEP_0113456810 /NCGR_PEP_ID=MMETSP0014_2-20120614/9081_1 /TAXON_ID=2857 /ORGANISM="Nitzschia sp." /LENGTH=78 /DNA_ID=CAMNT_0000348279 /DNA_START=982 /DNA_END=1218 /DNA_ORIENTATION=+ /assembly_acc=CAM_ASM_000159